MFATYTRRQVEDLAIYMEGAAASAYDSNHADKLRDASALLKKLAGRMCGQGYIGCDGGPNCDSDHA